MPDIVQCPHCQRQLRLSETMRGRTVRCPQCQGTFAVTGPPAPAPAKAPPARDPLDFSEPRRRPARRRREEDYEDEEDRHESEERDKRPHRGPLVLALGILSLVLCIAPLVGLALGMAAYNMGSADERQMAYGGMDRSGKGLTRAGKICGLIGTAASVFFLVLACVLAFAHR